MTYAYAEPSPFPPSYEGNPWSYAFGLFGDVVAGMLALAILLGYVFEARRDRHAAPTLPADPARAAKFQVQPWAAKISVLAIYRAYNICLLLFVILRSLPDALWMLLWGEVSEPTIEVLLMGDLIADGLALAPLSMAALCWAWSRQVLPHRLAYPTALQMPRLSYAVVRQYAKIVVAILVIAGGVTIGKAAA